MCYVSNGERKDWEVSFGIELPDGKVIKSLQEGESYKYLENLEADKFLEETMKLNFLKYYIRKLTKVRKD